MLKRAFDLAPERQRLRHRQGVRGKLIKRTQHRLCLFADRRR